MEITGILLGLSGMIPGNDGISSPGIVENT